MDESQANFMTMKSNQLFSFDVNIKIKLGFLWATIMSLYIYADYFNLMTPDSLKNMMELQTPVGPATPGILVAFSILLIIPALMISGSVLLQPVWSKWLNIIFGFIYGTISALMIIFNITSQWMMFFILYQVAELLIFALIIWIAWNWPKIKNE